MARDSIPMTPGSDPPLSTTVCVGSWLPPSETFIYDQLVNQNRVRAHVIARDRTSFAHRFPYDEVVQLGTLEQMSFYHAGIAPRVTAAMRRYRSRLVHAHFGPNGTMMLPFARALGVPLVVSFHGHDVGGLQPQNRNTLRYFRYQRLAPGLFRYGALFLCASAELEELLLRHGAPKERLCVHHLGVDLERFRPPEPALRTSTRVLMVGRLVEKKGMADGMDAFCRICRRHEDARLVIVGDGPLRAQLEQRAHRLGIAHRVVFRGALERSKVLVEMQQACVLLTPSFTTQAGDRESGVIVVTEAGATALPAVVTRHGGLPEIIDEGENGFLVPERDVTMLAERLDFLLSHKDERARMGRLARELVQRRYDSVKQNELLEERLLRVARDFASSRAG